VSSPGAWVEAPPESLPAKGVHACLVEQLPYWLDDELWEIELDGVIQRTPMQLTASRARLLQRVAQWTPGLVQEFGEACAFRARDSAADLLKQNGRRSDADQLTAFPSVSELARAARAMSAQSKTDFFANVAGYVADAATFARICDAGTASYVAADLARACSGSTQAAVRERTWQGRWIAERLQLATGAR
jgi:hypothetical protein